MEQMHSFGLIFNLFLFVYYSLVLKSLKLVPAATYVAEFLVFVASNKCDLLELKQTPPVSSV